MASYGTLRYRFVIFRNQFEFKDPRLPSDHVRYRRKASGSSNIWVYCEEFLTVPVINIYQDEPGKRRAQSSCARCRLMGWAPNAGYLPQSVYKNLCGFWSLSGLASEKGHPWFSQDVAEQSIKFRQSFIFVWMGIEGTVHFFNSRSARALICFHAVIIKIYERSLLCSNYSRSRPPVTVIRTHTNALTLGTLPPMHDLTIGSRATVTDIESCMSPSMGRRLLRTKGAHTHDSGRQCKQDTNGHQIAETDQSYSLKKKNGEVGWEFRQVQTPTLCTFAFHNTIYIYLTPKAGSGLRGTAFSWLEFFRTHLASLIVVLSNVNWQYCTETDWRQ